MSEFNLFRCKQASVVVLSSQDGCKNIPLVTNLGQKQVTQARADILGDIHIRKTHFEHKNLIWTHI